MPKVLTATTLNINPGSGYFEDAFGDASTLIADAEMQLANIDFDSMAAIGLSGMLVLPLLARHFGVPFMALRKQGENCHDSYGAGQFARGSIGKRWILVDDFVQSGATVAVARETVAAAIQMVDSRFRTEYVGCYCYARRYDNKYTAFVNPQGARKSLTSIEIDGETQYVDAEVYNYILRRIEHWEGSRDPKGQAIRDIRDTYLYEETDLDELSAIAIYAQKQIDNS